MAAWPTCREVRCGAAAADSEGRCLAHVDDETLRRLLAQASPGLPLDARGLAVSPPLLDRILGLAPKDAENRAVLRSARFGGATFSGTARFAGVSFVHDVSFDQTAFRGDTSFDGAGFGGHARFAGSTFDGKAGFADARFGSHAWFSGTAFGRDADFDGARFEGPAWFGAATFAADARFQRTSFGGDAFFDHVGFGCHVAFAEGLFERDISLDGATFNHPARYDGARFKGPGGAPVGAVGKAAWSGAPMAPWPKRAAAALVDHAVLAGLLVAAVLVRPLLDRLSYTTPVWALLAVALVVGMVVVVRNLITQGYTGQTPGKRRMGLCVVRQRDGMPIKPATSVIRYFLHVVDTVPFLLGWLAPLWTPARQTFADRLTACVVVEQEGWVHAAPVRPPVLPAAGFS